jgi:hypothetical protein
MVAPEVVVARVTSEAPFCTPRLVLLPAVIVGAVACVVLPLPLLVVLPPPPQPARRAILAHNAHRNPEIMKSTIRLLSPLLLHFIRFNMNLQNQR